MADEDISMKKTNGLGSEKSHSRGSSTVIPTIIITDYDAELAMQLQLISDQCNQAKDCSGSRSQLAESEEEDREIIESLTKAHSNNANRDIDVDEACSSNQLDAEMKSEDRKENLPSTSSAIEDGARGLLYQMELMTDDDRADLEVSQLTSLLESKSTFSPLPGNSSQSFQKANARLIPTMPPPGVLPNIDDFSLPRRVPARRNTGFIELPPLDPGPRFEDFLFNDVAGSSSSGTANGSAVTNTLSADRGECLPRTSGGCQFESRRTNRLYGECDSDSQYSSSSSTADVNSESSDEQPPQYWKLYDNESNEKSDAGNEDDINQILQTFHVVNTIDDLSTK